MSSVTSSSNSQLTEGLPPFPVRRFTVEEYFELARIGFFGEDENFELLQGYIVPKMVKYPLHENALALLIRLLQPMIPAGWFVRSQGVVQTADSAPEPDISITRGFGGEYPDRHPTGDDVALVVEIADSSIKRDRNKVEVYGAAGVAAYCIVNLRERVFEMFANPETNPTGQLAYSLNQVATEQDVIDVIVEGKTIGTINVAQFFEVSFRGFSPTEPK